MKKQQVNHMYNTFLKQELPEFKLNGHLLFNFNIEYLLQGFFFESSAFDKDTFTIEYSFNLCIFQRIHWFLILEIGWV
jgi:hypothetical protein